MRIRSIKRYGWRPGLPDGRDLRMSAPSPMTPIPISADLRNVHMPPVYDQGDTGSCTGNSSVAGFEYELHKQTGIFLGGSRLFAYYNARVLEGDPEGDNGAEIRSVIKCMANSGLCVEGDWPFDPKMVTVKPFASCYTEALLHKELQYTRVSQNAMYLRHCLGVLALPVVFGFTVYDSFESDVVAMSGVAPMPGPDESVVGGHAVLLVGYDDLKKTYIVRNSWGKAWGQKGYFTLPYEYVHNSGLAEDFWAIQLVD